MSVYCNVLPSEDGRWKAFDRRVGILIPAYNEMAHISGVVQACCRLNPAIILVVDDCSNDSTPLVLEKEVIKNTGRTIVRALRNGRNLGKQGSVKKGLRVLREYELDAICLIDGDGQHDPAELPSLVRHLDDYDFIIGARSREHMPLHRQFSNWLVNLGFRLIGGVDFVDVQSGLRVYRRELAEVLADGLCEEGGYALEHESLTALARYSREQDRDLYAAAAPISCGYGEDTSSMQPLHVLQLGFETIRQAHALRKASGEPAVAG